jgi:methyl coenzyme M reductase alpha subunit
MSEPVAYRSKVRIERVQGPLRRAYLPAEPLPVHFGVHSEIAQHYGVDPKVHAPRATTLDYIVAAAAG